MNEKKTHIPNFVKIYTITVLNSSSTDQWLRKDITTSSSSEQANGLDINLDTILNNYPYVKTECFSYEDSGFNSKDDINSFQQQQQILQPQSNVTTTSIMLDSTLSASSDLINYTDVSNNAEWSIEQNEIKDWESNEAISNVSKIHDGKLMVISIICLFFSHPLKILLFLFYIH